MMHIIHSVGTVLSSPYPQPVAHRHQLEPRLGALMQALHTRGNATKRQACPAEFRSAAC